MPSVGISGVAVVMFQATLRNPEASNCAGTQPLAGNRRVTTLLRDSSGPFVAARVMLQTRK